MSLPQPIPGLIIRYSDLWHREFVQGREEGQKERPCAIVAAIRADPSGATRVLVLPITHSPPHQSTLAIEIPEHIKQRLQLDDARSWVVLSEWNEFIWPGPDLRTLPGGTEASVAYGMLPPSLFGTIRDQFLSLIRSRVSHRIERSE